MSTVYPVSIINARLQVVVNAIDGGGSNGVLRVVDSGNVILSSITLARPSGTVAGGVLTFAGTPLGDPSAAANGTAAAARVEDSNGNVVISGWTVSPFAGSDVVISNGLGTAVITAGQAISLTIGNITGH